MRTLFFMHPGTNSRDIFADMASGFESAGHGVLRVELATIAAVAQHSPEAATAFITDLIRSNRIELSIGLWANTLLMIPPVHQGQSRIPFFDAAPHTHLLFWLDAPHWAHQGEASKLFATPIVRHPRIRHLINNPGTADEMNRILGFPNSLASPYGINPDIFHAPAKPPTPEFDIVFGGGPGDPNPTPLMLEQIERDVPDLAAIRAERAEKIRTKLPKLQARLPDADPAKLGVLLDRWLESQLADPHRTVLSRLDDIAQSEHTLAPTIDTLRTSPSAFVAMSAAVRSIEAFRRAFTIAYLAKRHRLATFGSIDLDAWGVETTHLGQLPYAEMPNAFARAKLGLNAMRWQDDVGVNIKPLEITASGTACLCEQRTGLGELFEPNDVFTFDAPHEAHDVAVTALRDHELRQHIQKSGTDRTHRDHTWGARSLDIETCLSLEKQGRAA